MLCKKYYNNIAKHEQLMKLKLDYMSDASNRFGVHSEAYAKCLELD